MEIITNISLALRETTMPADGVGSFIKGEVRGQNSFQLKVDRHRNPVAPAAIGSL
jgi:hypothetical protein